jgi:RNA polymerase sigma-70 factor (ECF subfamily)
VQRVELHTEAVTGPWRGKELLVDNPDGETVLLAAARAGDHSALERLLSEHEQALFALCRGILEHDQEAEDAVQETLLRALRGLQGFRGGASVRTWLTRIAINVCLDCKRARRPVSSTREHHALTSPSPEGRVTREAFIEEALSRLMPRHRTILLLKELEGWSVAEIARALRCTSRRIYHELSIAHATLADWRTRYEREGE